MVEGQCSAQVTMVFRQDGSNSTLSSPSGNSSTPRAHALPYCMVAAGLRRPALRLPPNVANVARRASPAPVTSARLHGEAARQGRRRRCRRGCAGGKVVLEEAEDDDDVPVTVQDADEEAEVNDLP